MLKFFSIVLISCFTFGAVGCGVPIENEGEANTIVTADPENDDVFVGPFAPEYYTTMTFNPISGSMDNYDFVDRDVEVTEFTNEYGTSTYTVKSYGPEKDIMLIMWIAGDTLASVPAGVYERDDVLHGVGCLGPQVGEWQFDEAADEVVITVSDAPGGRTVAYEYRFLGGNDTVRHKIEGNVLLH